MKKFVLMFALAAFVFAFSGKASAETDKPGKTGIVTSIDKAGFSIKRDGDEKAFTFECKSEVIKGLKKGDHVDVWYEKSGEARIASKVELVGGGSGDSKKEDKKKGKKTEGKQTEEKKKEGESK